MPVFQFDDGGGKIVEIDAPDQAQALDAFESTRVSGGKAAYEGTLSGASLGFRNEIKGASVASGLPDYLGGFRAPVGAAKLAFEHLTAPTAPPGEEPQAGPVWQKYQEARDAARGVQETAKEQHPYLYGGGEAVGTVATSMLPAGAVGAGASLASNVARGALVGAGTGAVQGAGEAKTIADIPREGATGGVIGGVLGAAVPAVVGGVRRAISPLSSLAPERQAAANVLAREGVELTPGQLSGGRRMRYFESEQGGNLAPEFVAQQERNFTRAALRRAGIDADNARPEVIDAAFTRIGGGFDQMAASSVVRVDRPLINDLMKSVVDYQTLTPPSMRVPAVQNIVGNIADALNANQGVLSGEVYQSLRTRINELARGASNANLKDAFRGLQSALDGAVERNLPQHMQDAWRTLRSQYRNMLVIEKAATAAGPNAAEGVLSPQLLRGALVQQNRRSYGRGTGDFAELVRAGNLMMAKLPETGTASRLKAHGVSAAITGAAGGLIGGGAAGGEGGNTFGGTVAGGAIGALAPAAAARVVLSNLGRRWLSTPRLPGPAGPQITITAPARQQATEEYKARRLAR